MSLINGPVAVAGIAIPDTPAGEVLSGWLQAFDSGNSLRIDSFDKAHIPWLSLDSAMALRARTGGYDLLSIEKSGRLWITFRAKQKVGPTQVSGSLVVKSFDPKVVSLLSLSHFNPKPMDGAERRRVIKRAAKVLDELYVYPTVGQQMAAALRMQQSRGEYRAIADPEIFAMRLTDDLRAISHDQHLRVVYRPARSPSGTPASAAGGEQPQGNNCDFDKVERYTDDVGYVKFDGFVDSHACVAVAIAAMEFLAHVKAIIFDLRDNHGGSGGVGVMLESYLFERPTHLEDFWDRRTGETHQVWTLPYVPGERLGPIPAYVLTSDMTFSGGEAFAYELQALKRATVVGEVTGGGAHLVSPERLDERFVMGVPTGRPINPITKTDWEGKGVIPDVKVPASEALVVAKRLASQALKTRS